MTKIFSYPCAIPTLCLLDRLVFCSLLCNRLSGLNWHSWEDRPKLFRLECAAGDATLALLRRQLSQGALKGF